MSRGFAEGYGEGWGERGARQAPVSPGKVPHGVTPPPAAAGRGRTIFVISSKCNHNI